MDPADPVSVMLGKNAARATPMLALAERKTASADAISGRASNTSLGILEATDTCGFVISILRPSGSSSAGTLVPTSVANALRYCATEREA